MNFILGSFVWIRGKLGAALFASSASGREGMELKGFSLE